MLTYQEKTDQFQEKLNALLVELYPNQFIGNCKLFFNQGVFKGINVDLREIDSIDFTDSFVNYHTFFKESFTHQIMSLRVNLKYVADRKRLYLNNGKYSYEFPETEEGMELKAVYVVLVLGATLKFIQEKIEI